MIIFKTRADLQGYLAERNKAGDKIGFIPTMGAIHSGHLSLVQRAKADNTLAVCSIFVNPTQFNDKSDFEKYPISLEDDIALLISVGCDALFLPSVNEIYTEGAENAKTYDFGYLDTILEGAKRPGHFKGVGQVVAILLDIVKPQHLYMGQKDYQQCTVVSKLLELMGKNSEIKMVICDTMREADGLAMSSRNRRLSEPQRAKAGVIYQCLVSIQGKQDNTSFQVVQKECIELLTDKGFAPEYVALADARDLSLLDNYKPEIPMVALIAAKLGEIRLIDNLLINAVV